jgi:hypothetical protein
VSSTCRLALLIAILVPPPVWAHPVPKDNHDRTVVVQLTPDSVIVDYRLELDESRAVLDLPRSALAGAESRKDVHVAFRRHFAPILADNLVATLDGKEVTFECREQRSEVLDHVRCDYRFVAPWKLTAGRSHRFTFREGNFPLDSFSALSVKLVSNPVLTVRDVSEPGARLIELPADQRKPGDEERLRRLSAIVQSGQPPQETAKVTPREEAPPAAPPKGDSVDLLDWRHGLVVLALLAVVLLRLAVRWAGPRSAKKS